MAQSKDVVKQIRRATRRKFSAEDKIRIVLEGLRGEVAISEVCRREGIAASVYCMSSAKVRHLRLKSRGGFRLR